MKKYFLILLSLIVLLVSCGGQSTLPDESITSNDNSDTSYHFVSENPEESTEESGDITEFLTLVNELLDKDERLTSLIILGEIYKDETDINGGVIIAPLSGSNEFYEYSRLKELANSVYTGEGGEYVLNFPPYGTNTVVNVSEKTWYSTHFVPDYSDKAATLRLLSFDENRSKILVTTQKGIEVELDFVNTPEGWRMAECLYKAVTDKINSASSSDEYKSTAMGMGSASALTGNCLIINVFLSDSVSEWEDGDVEKSLSRLGNACDFAETLSAYYGQSLDITSTDKAASLYLKTSDKIPADINEFVWIDLLFSDTVYKSLEGYAASHFDLESYDNWCVMFHLNKKGRSYAIPCDRANSDWEHYTAERCVVFHTDDENYSYYDSSGVYAHELFHLFGAADLYAPYISNDDSDLLNNYFPNDIMRTIPLDIELASVSPFTAFRLGWLGYLDQQFTFLIN